MDLLSILREMITKVLELKHKILLNNQPLKIQAAFTTIPI